MADEHSAGKSIYKKVRLYVMVGFGLLAVIIILQNMETVETEVLFWKIPMPSAVLLAATLLTGFAGGVVWTGWRRRK